MEQKKPSRIRVVLPMLMTFVALLLAMDYGRLLLDGDTSARKIFAFCVWSAMVFVWGRISVGRLRAFRGTGAD